MNPHVGSGNNWRPRNAKASNEFHDLELKTGYTGWYSMKHAIAAINRLKAADEKGQHDTTDNYNKKCQVARYEFKIVKLTMSMKVEELTVDMMCEAV